MTSEYTRTVLKVVVAQICQTIGWHAINSSPLEFMVDLMQEYILRISKLSHDYAEHFGRTEVNLDDLGLAFQNLSIDLNEIAEYVKNVDPVPCVVAVPKLPIPRENHLNFLKPGSREVVSRPVHVYEHLPPMYPENEEDYPLDIKQEDSMNSTANNEPLNSSEDDSGENNSLTGATIEILIEENLNKAVPQAVFKRPGDPISNEGTALKRMKTSDNGRPLREIHSVIMTTSGFLSTAREGKLPEARTPHQERIRSPTPPPEDPIVPPPDIPVEKKLKKIPKKTGVLDEGKPENKENKKKKIPKETLFEPDKVKKFSGVKEKTPKVGGSFVGPSSGIEVPGKMNDENSRLSKNNVVTSKAKSEKIIGMQNSGDSLLNEPKEETIDKLPTELDKQKLNIFKKISSKSKDTLESPQQKSKESAFGENVSNVIGIDLHCSNDNDIRQDDKKSIVQNHVISKVLRSEEGVANMLSPGSEDVHINSYSEMSPPRTPGTPKTPEINLPVEQKKKKKDKSSKKKEQKINLPKNVTAKKARLSNDSVSSEIDILDRPKTPQAPEQPISRDFNLPSTPMNQFQLFPFSAPGLIPNPLFSHILQKGSGMGVPNPAMMRPNMPIPSHLFRPPTKLDPGNRQPGMPPPFITDPGFSAKQQVPPLLGPQQIKSIKPLEKESNLPTSFQGPDMMNPLPNINNMGGSQSMASLTTLSPAVPAPLLPPNSFINPEISINKSIKPEKADKALKKLKEHKKDKKDKLKKKKEKKEKHRDKGEKTKEKKDKSEKKDKLEKLREKKEKKEKRKEKEAIKKIAKEEKIIEGVPKLTIKLETTGGSPRASTPDSALTKKITIKPPKKPDEDVKREPTPELARISALITRPPKQKSSKKLEDGLLEAYSTLPMEASFSNSLNPSSRVKKPVFKPMPEKDSNPNLYNQYLNPYESSLELQKTQYCFTDQAGRTVWICPACGKQDDGSAMIGCDECDAWYHWVCVGIQVAPASNEDWYCRICISKKQEQYHDKKKKKRKKKNAA